jgi:hypothetical protein
MPPIKPLAFDITDEEIDEFHANLRSPSAPGFSSLRVY